MAAKLLVIDLHVPALYSPDWRERQEDHKRDRRVTDRQE